MLASAFVHERSAYEIGKDYGPVFFGAVTAIVAVVAIAHSNKSMRKQLRQMKADSNAARELELDMERQRKKTRIYVYWQKIQYPNFRIICALQDRGGGSEIIKALEGEEPKLWSAIREMEEALVGVAWSVAKPTLEYLESLDRACNDIRASIDQTGGSSMDNHKAVHHFHRQFCHLMEEGERLSGRRFAYAGFDSHTEDNEDAGTEA